MKGDVQPLGQLAERLGGPPELFVLDAQSRKFLFVPPDLLFQRTHLFTHPNLTAAAGSPRKATGFVFRRLSRCFQQRQGVNHLSYSIVKWRLSHFRAPVKRGESSPKCTGLVHLHSSQVAQTWDFTAALARSPAVLQNRAPFLIWNMPREGGPFSAASLFVAAWLAAFGARAQTGAPIASGTALALQLGVQTFGQIPERPR
jgi:hypothetical protein